MHYPQIYIGTIPSNPQQRRVLRARALDLRLRLRPTREPVPIFIVLHFATGTPAAGMIDLLIVRPNTIIVGALREYRSPIMAQPGGPWLMPGGVPLLEASGSAPLEHVGIQRDAVRAQLVADRRLQEHVRQPHTFDRMIGALICMPALHPDSKIALDIEDHRRQLKVLGLEELQGLAVMVASGMQLSEHAMHIIVSETLGGQLWHDGTQLLFELACPAYQLRLLSDETGQKPALPILEGPNVIGRRRIARPHEHRLTLNADDLISNDHAVLHSGENGMATIRDTSKNGTWITLPGASEIYLHNAEHPISPGTLIRMGVTVMRFERVEQENP